MVMIRVLNIAGGADTSSQGDVFWEALIAALSTSEDVTASFRGVNTATSSFVNASFVRLLDRMAFDEIKRRVAVVDSNRQINDMIRTRLTREASHQTVA